MATTAEMLTEVQAAITKCLEAQSYSVLGRSASRATLESLQKRESELLRRQARETNGSSRAFVRLNRP